MADELIHSTAIIDWVNSFELDITCESLSDISDGYILGEICHQIAPGYFEMGFLSPSDGNFLLAGSNIKKLLRSLDEYYQNVLSKRLPVPDIDMNKIVREHDLDEVWAVVEMVVGASILCENKATFVERIMKLSTDSKATIQSMIQNILSSVEEFHGGAAGDSGSVATGTTAGEHSEELIRSQEMIRHLQEEKKNLLASAQELEKKNKSLESELSSARGALHQREEEEEKSKSAEDPRLTEALRAKEDLQAELDETKRQADLHYVELEKIQANLKAEQQKVKSSLEIQTKLEMEAQQTTDELDVLRDKARQLAQAESAIAKYKTKMEEVVALKKQNKELTDQMERYLDKIHDLEASKQGMATQAKLVEQYKDRAVELEREKFEAVSAKELQDHEVKRLNIELESTVDAKRFLEDELEAAKSEMAELQEATGTSGGIGVGGDAFEIETIPTLKEKIHKLERELRVAQSGAGSGSTGAASHSIEEMVQKIAFLQAELDDVKQAKKDREDSLKQAKKEVSDLTNELTKTNRALQDAENSHVAASGAKEAEQKLAVANNTIKMLEEKLKEKESTINQLEQEKGKLENYARRTLSAFKEKYMAALQTMKAEKKALEDRLAVITSKSDRDHETARREERLLLSSMYEIGVRLMDRKIQEQVSLHSLQHSTYLGSQRAAQVQATLGLSGASGGSAPSSLKTPSK